MLPITAFFSLLKTPQQCHRGCTTLPMILGQCSSLWLSDISLNFPPSGWKGHTVCLGLISVCHLPPLGEALPRRWGCKCPVFLSDHN